MCFDTLAYSWRYRNLLSFIGLSFILFRNYYLSLTKTPVYLAGHQSKTIQPNIKLYAMWVFCVSFNYRKFIKNFCLKLAYFISAEHCLLYWSTRRNFLYYEKKNLWFPFHGGKVATQLYTDASWYGIGEAINLLCYASRALWKGKKYYSNSLYLVCYRQHFVFSWIYKSFS